jgi:hypothetical protein
MNIPVKKLACDESTRCQRRYWPKWVVLQRVLFIPSSNQVQVEMKYHLPAPFLYIEKKLVPGGIYFLLFGHLPGGHNHFRENAIVRFGEIVDASDMPFGNDQQMDGSVGVDVSENHKVPVLV